MTNRLFVATSNAGKLRDFALAAERYSSLDGDGPGLCLEPIPGLDGIPTPAEDADSFEGNAREKAIYYSLRAPGALVIADDSGLEVDALGGAPGVYSARYAERGSAPAIHWASQSASALDYANNAHLLAELVRVLAPDGLEASLDHRGARYRSALAAARDGVCLSTAEGLVAGFILQSPRGEGGFGYDPLFYLPTLDRTMAQIGPDTRLNLSHRGAALRALLAKLAGLPLL